MSVDAHFFYYNFEDYFASSIIIIIFGYDVEVVPVRRIGDQVQNPVLKIVNANK